MFLFFSTKVKTQNMLFENFCGINVNLVKAGVFVGVLDIFSIILEIYDDYSYYFECKLQTSILSQSIPDKKKLFLDDRVQIAALAIFSVAVLCAVLLIHGALTVNSYFLLSVYLKNNFHRNL